MMMKPLYYLFIIFSLVGFSSQGQCLDGKDIVRLKKGGISEETIQVIIQEKVIETCAFTVQEILDLKTAGMSNNGIQKIIEKGSFIKDTKPIEYGGKELRAVKFNTINDIIELKQAGISDDVIVAIVCGIEKKDDEDYERAWEMLENMGLIIDER